MCAQPRQGLPTTPASSMTAEDFFREFDDANRPALLSQLVEEWPGGCPREPGMHEILLLPLPLPAQGFLGVLWLALIGRLVRLAAQLVVAGPCQGCCSAAGTASSGCPPPMGHASG